MQTKIKATGTGIETNQEDQKQYSNDHLFFLYTETLLW